MRSPIERGDEGADVAAVQDRLNRLGALLLIDGKFGGGTEDAVRTARAIFNLPPGTAVDVPLWDKLGGLAEPCNELPTRGVTFIAREEVGSRSAYDRIYCHPAWPGGDSGITIGIGYDLRFADAAAFQTDWQAEIPNDVSAALHPWLGQQGTRIGAEALRDKIVPFQAAWKVFLKRTIPATVKETERVFPGYNALPALCRSALVSLVYNRGGSLAGDTRIEMRAIRDLIAAKNFGGVPDQFVAMKHLWPDVRGLRDRRDHEAALWREGLGG